MLQQLVDKSSATEKVKSLENLANLWARSQNLIVSAHYFEEAAKLDSTKDKWKTAGDYYFVGLQNTGDTAAKLFAGQRSFECYAAASRFDTSDTKLKVLEAVSLIDGVGNVMSGVLLLKEVEKTDPDNELMNVTWVASPLFQVSIRKQSHDWSERLSCIRKTRKHTFTSEKHTGQQDKKMKQ